MKNLRYILKISIYAIMLMLTASCAIFYPKQKMVVDPVEQRIQHSTHCQGYEDDTNSHFRVLAKASDENFLEAIKKAEKSAVEQLALKLEGYYIEKGKTLSKPEALAKAKNYIKACHATIKEDSGLFTHYIGAELAKK